MLRIIFATDLHLRSSKPISRLDNDFFAMQLAKIDEVRQISSDEKADLVILGGDIVDRPDCQHSVVIGSIRAFRAFNQPIFTVLGNHDTFGFSGQSIGASGLGVLLESGVVKKLDTLNIGNVSIYGLHAHDDNNWTVPDNPGMVKILVAHKMITNISIPDAECFLLKNIARETNADILLSGDIHTPHLERVGGRLFVNPGSLTRMSIADRERQPQVAIVTVEDDGEFDAEFRSLSIRPAETVFDLQSYSNRMAQETHAKDFVRTYVQAIVSVKAEANNVGTVLLDFLDANGVGEEINKHIRAYLERAQKEVLKETEE